MTDPTTCPGHSWRKPRLEVTAGGYQIQIRRCRRCGLQQFREATQRGRWLTDPNWNRHS